MTRISALLGACACIVFWSGPANAESVTSQLTVSHVVETGDGTEVLEPAESVAPGETLEYELVYTNETGMSLNAFTVVGPVPEGTDFIEGSAQTNTEARLEAQIAGMGWAPVPAFRAIVQPDGTVIQEEVPAEEYEALRWRLSGEVAPGLSVQATYRVRVED